MARSARGAFICFANGAAYHCYELFTGAPFAERYFTPEGALLSFAAGALIVSFLGSKPSSSDEERLEPFFSHRLTP